jgi:hypothetical protein
MGMDVDADIDIEGEVEGEAGLRAHAYWSEASARCHWRRPRCLSLPPSSPRQRPRLTSTIHASSSSFTPHSHTSTSASFPARLSASTSTMTTTATPKPKPKRLARPGVCPRPTKPRRPRRPRTVARSPNRRFFKFGPVLSSKK